MAFKGTCTSDTSVKYFTKDMYQSQHSGSYRKEGKLETVLSRGTGVPSTVNVALCYFNITF